MDSKRDRQRLEHEKESKALKEKTDNEILNNGGNRWWIRKGQTQNTDNQTQLMILIVQEVLTQFKTSWTLDGLVVSRHRKIRAEG